MPEPAYAITEGGPFRRLARALGLLRDDRADWVRCAAATLAICYLPLLIVGPLWLVFEGEWPPALAQVSTHVRALVAIPLLLAAEPLVEVRARGAGRYLVESGLISGPAELEAYRAAIARTVRLRNSPLVEGMLLAGAIASAFVDRTYAGGGAWHAHATVPAASAFRFLLLRWLWHWLLWGLFLWRVARLRLALRATHPDRLAGLGPLLGPAYAFGAIGGACSATIAAAWGDLALREHTAVSTFAATAVTYAFGVVVLALMPTCVFAPALYRARRAGLTSFGAFAHRFVSAFEERRMGASGPVTLDDPEISSLCDLGGSYAVVAEMNVVPWSHRLLLILVACALAPMLPLVLLDLDVPDLVLRLGNALL